MNNSSSFARNAASTLKADTAATAGAGYIRPGVIGEDVWKVGNRYYYCSRRANRIMPLARVEAEFAIATGVVTLVQKPEWA